MISTNTTFKDLLYSSRYGNLEIHVPFGDIAANQSQGCRQDFEDQKV